MSSNDQATDPSVPLPYDDAAALRTRRRVAFDAAWPVLLGAGLGGAAAAALGATAGLAVFGVGALGHSLSQRTEQTRTRLAFAQALGKLGERPQSEIISEPAKTESNGEPTDSVAKASSPVPTDSEEAIRSSEVVAELERRLASSESARRGQSALLAELAPEITGALRGISRISEALGETDLTLEQRDCVETIDGSTGTLIQLLGDVLDLAKIESGRLKLRRKDFHLSSSLDSIVEELYPMAWKKGLELSIEVSSELGDWYFGDERRLAQLVRHLMRGSIQTTDRGEVRLCVLPSVPEQPSSGPLRIEIHDSAPVHTQAELARLTEGSPSSLESLAELDLSLGLGLARGLAEVMGGELGAHAKGEGGNLFWVEIPLETSRQPHGAMDSDFAALIGLRLLVVDARTNARESLVAATERLGLIVYQACDREQAMEILHRAALEDEPFDSLLVDDDLQGGQGRDLVAEVSEAFGEARPAVVLLTSAGRAQNPARMAEIGIDAWIPKPVRIQRLQEALLFVHGDNSTDEPTEAPLIEPGEALTPTEVRSRVLLVQSDPLRGRITSAWLTRMECRVDVTESFGSLPSMFSDGVYDLILLDCTAEPLERHRVLREVRMASAASGSRLRIVVIHPDSSETDQLTVWLDAGACRCWPLDLVSNPTGELFSNLLSENYLQSSSSTNLPEAMNFEPETTLDPEVVQSLKELGGDDDPGLFGELVDLFLRDMPPRLGALDEALQSKDAKALERAAHSMKSSCGNLGAMGLAELCRQIELFGRAGDVDSAQSLVQSSRDEYERVCTALSQELSNG